MKEETDNGAGFLEIGTNDKHQVVVNLPRDMTGHIVFSQKEARGLANTLRFRNQKAKRWEASADD